MTQTMTVPVFKGEGRLEYEERPIPQLEEATDVLVKIEACGICGTDLGADIVVDAVGNQMGTAIKLARRGGQVILFGLRPHDNPTTNQYTISRYDLTIHGTFVGLNPFEQTIQLLESGRLQPSVLITHRVPLSQLPQGVDLMRSGQTMKVIVETEG